MPRSLIAFITALALHAGMAAPVYAQGRPVPYPLPEAPVVLETINARINVSVVAEGIPRPFGFAVLPDGDILVTDRYTPALRVIRDDMLDPEPLQGLPAIRTGFHSGLLDVEAHPDYTNNQLIYLTYHTALETDGEYAITLGRARYDGSDTLADFEQLFIGTPMTISGGSRMVFAPDGKLFVTVGGAMDRRPLAQDLARLEGKVLRLNADGSIPADNPFVGQADVHPAIYSYGHRDQYAVAIHPETGELFHAELGPLGGDKLNVIKAGGNYGWPLYGYGSYNDGEPMEKLPREGFESALLIWQPGIVPSGLMFYSGDAFPQWQGNLFAGSIQRGRLPGSGGLERLVFNENMWELQRETLVTELHQRIRDVAQGPDGFIYLLTEEDNGAVLKLQPAQ
ncbi:PQQ-dependent sugar dehydrogenase [Pseudohongiella sp.]|uniref:Glucose/Sorbosone dehydrogenase domain-containing protein n=1 Tax=marine sediment metagenome TaxID=412755 RepID=A0A0F9VY65_9ZZZZ|nr:PQQ-dependent sugar dehydrogenase [Pseudohongiella sp.]HDZ07989.1 PQQ-dependent sugar dehydrogenase [Pseudohongiella sp.]HEA64168.1 PQQ-dependent sugar dehydrogenase [Pseudohongiella sp.]